MLSYKCWIIKSGMHWICESIITSTIPHSNVSRWWWLKARETQKAFQHTSVKPPTHSPKNHKTPLFKRKPHFLVHFVQKNTSFSCSLKEFSAFCQFIMNYVYKGSNQFQTIQRKTWKKSKAKTKSPTSKLWSYDKLTYCPIYKLRSSQAKIDLLNRGELLLSLLWQGIPRCSVDGKEIQLIGARIWKWVKQLRNA